MVTAQRGLILTERSRPETGWGARTLWKATEPSAIQVRLAGAVVAGIGLFLTLENAEGLVFDLLSWTS